MLALGHYIATQVSYQELKNKCVLMRNTFIISRQLARLKVN